MFPREGGLKRFTNIFCLSLDDISYNKIATQSHTYYGEGYDASNAVDKNTATCIRTNVIGVTNPDKTTWWKVDLGGVSSIYSVNIQFKSYDKYGVYYLGIYLSYI